MAVTRRTFLKSAALLAGTAILPTRPGVFPGWYPSTDEELCLERFLLAKREGLEAQPMGAIMVAIGRTFIGTPYAPGTLEIPGEERLVVNLRELDCVTFVENTLALARCIKQQRTTFDFFTEELQCIRYRGGIIDGYPSRLHYFSDWMYDNEQKNIVRDVTSAVGGKRYSKTIAFMSTHRQSYRQLADRECFDAIRETEGIINARKMFFIPKDQVETHRKRIMDGDIIAITTAVDGLDISHTGLALWVDGVLKYLHAPLTNGHVQITGRSLAGYLTSNKKQTGIMVARPLEPDRIK